MARVILLILLLAGFAPGARADDPAPLRQTEEQRTQERIAAVDEAFEKGTHGPAQVALRDLASLKVPSGMLFVPLPQAARVMRALGNAAGDSLVGLVLGDGAPWVVVIRYESEGYVKDDEAKDWNPDDLLKNLQESTEDGNLDRIARGFKAIEMTGWLQPPAYDSATHRLSWATLVRQKGDADAASQGVNYNTRALGREGYLSVNLLTNTARFEKEKPVAVALLGGLDYNSGKRYEDFDSSTDHVAEYGLAALLGVVVAKKLGLIALAGVFVLKFAKVGALALAGIGIALGRIFRRKPKPIA